MPVVTISALRGAANTQVPDVHAKGSKFSLVWSNSIFDAVSGKRKGTEAIIMLLRVLLSTGTGTNSLGSFLENYDRLADGMGLGIPHDQVDVAGFEALRNHYDYDDGQQVFFLFNEPQEAKKYIEEELCRPFGYSLVTGNDGKLRLIRPLHPQKFHISKANNELKIQYPTGSTPAITALLTVGVYTGQQLAAEVASTLSAATAGSNFTCTYDTVNHKFIVAKGEAFDIVAADDKSWLTLGFETLGSSPITNVTTTTLSHVAARGVFTGPTIDKNDIWDVKLIENRNDQITGVTFLYNYSKVSEEYRAQRRFIDAESVNLGDTLGGKEFIIKSRGLVSNHDYSRSSFGSFRAPSSGCDPGRVDVETKVGIEEDSWARTYAMILLDRYKNPPLKFKAKLGWGHNLLEIGDVVRLDYDIAGVFADYELDESTIAGRLFEVVQVNPNFRDGYLEVTFLGHRYVSY